MSVKYTKSNKELKGPPKMAGTHPSYSSQKDLKAIINSQIRTQNLANELKEDLSFKR